MNKSKLWFENIRSLLMATVMLSVVLVLGTLGFMYLNPAYSIIDGFYMTVITISTVGFNEVHPSSDLGKVFTIALIFTSFGIFGYIGTAVTRFIIDGVFRRNLKDYRMSRRIEKLTDHVIVCGYGRNGRQACAELLNHGETVVVIDKREDTIEKIKENPDLLYLFGDSTHEEVLQSANIAEAKALITAIPHDAENVYVVLTARELNPRLLIISRSSSIQSESKLKRAGADNVIMPDRMGGQHMAKLVSQPDVIEFLDNILLEKNKDVALEEISCEKLSPSFIGKSIRELNVRDKSGANIIGLKAADGSYVINPSPDMVLDLDINLFVLGSNKQLQSLRKILVKGI